ncbi:MAG: hypothetical protein FWG35_00065, partial [Spirochaetaceae bacterium]|nr:hypothetical protein [Spirochaetaceae bacterium]
MNEAAKFVEMATSEMQLYEASYPKLIRKLELDARAAIEDLNMVVERTRMQFYYAQVREIIERHYSIGKLQEMHQIFGGYVNTTFGIYTEKNGEK